MWGTSVRCAALAIVLAAASAQAAPELRVVGQTFQDAAGRTVVLRGVNVAGNSKVPPFRPITGAELFAPLPTWGLNTVRLLFTWEAYEPTRGSYDASYLDYYTQAVRWAHQSGLYVIVDFHQDAYSRSSIGGCGEGFPAWAIPAGVAAATPDNGAACANWGSRELSDPDEKASWHAFFADSEGARTRYLAMLASVAGKLHDEPGVIGYDLINEPFADEPTELGPLYADAAPAIRAVHPGAILFVSPDLLTGDGTQTKLPRPGFDNFAYSPHYYDPFVILLHRWAGTGPTEAFQVMTAKAREWGVPLLVGEFGGPADTVRIDEYMDALYGELDAALASGTQWVYTPGWTPAAKDGWNAEDTSIVDDHGQLRANFQPRPYPTRIAGNAGAFSAPVAATPAERTLTLDWQHDPATGASQLYVPAGYFGGAPAVAAAGDLRCSFSDPSHLDCSAPTAGAKHVALSAHHGGGGCAAVGPLPLLFPLYLRRRRARRLRR